MQMIVEIPLHSPSQLEIQLHRHLVPIWIRHIIETIRISAFIRLLIPCRTSVLLILLVGMESGQILFIQAPWLPERMMPFTITTTDPVSLQTLLHSIFCRRTQIFLFLEKQHHLIPGYFVLEMIIPIPSLVFQIHAMEEILLALHM